MSDKKKILIIDDEPDIIKVTAFRLKKVGFEVIIAIDGTSGLEKAASEKPDFILLDLGLPDIDGSEVCKKLKSTESLKKIPVVILSASSDSIKKEAEKAKAESYLLKPYEPEELIATANKYIL